MFGHAHGRVETCPTRVSPIFQRKCPPTGRPITGPPVGARKPTGICPPLRMHHNTAVLFYVPGGKFVFSEDLIVYAFHLSGYFFTYPEESLFSQRNYRIVKQRIISDHRRVSTGWRTLPGGGGWRWMQMHCISKIGAKIVIRSVVQQILET